jgi:hypothetical protein
LQVLAELGRDTMAAKSLVVSLSYYINFACTAHSCMMEKGGFGFAKYVTLVFHQTTYSVPI